MNTLPSRLSQTFAKSCAVALRCIRRGRRTTTTAAFERAAAKAKEEKERIAPEAREAERARRRGIQSQAEQAARDQKFERYDVRRERLDDALLDFSPESKSTRTSTWPWRSANCAGQARNLWRLFGVIPKALLADSSGIPESRRG
jgi:hypothetical protein